MTTYVDTPASLSLRVAQADLVVLARGLRELEVAQDPLAPADRAIGTFAVDIDTVLGGELGPGEVRVRMLGAARGDGVEWGIPALEGPLVLLLQRESAPGAETYVLYESSAWPVVEERIKVADELVDAESRRLVKQGAITVKALGRLHAQERKRVSERDSLRTQREADAPRQPDEPAREAPGQDGAPARAADVLPPPEGGD